MRSALDRLFPRKGSVLLDGAMGTALHQRGWPRHMATVLANLEAIQLVESVHREHRQAGAQVLLTNTFGVLLGGQREQRVEATRRAVRTARDAAAGGAVVAGALAAYDLVFHGPRLDEVLRCMVEEGVDMLVFETCNQPRDAWTAIEVSGRLAPSLPTVVSATTTDGSHADRKRVADIASLVRGRHRHHHVELGLNCCRGPYEALRVALSMDPLPRWIKPSTGAPGDQVDAHVMAAFARAARLRGIRYIGGCCGTTADTLDAMAGALGFVEGPGSSGGEAS